MPRGPKGEKRPADVVKNAVHIMRIATGEIADDKVEKSGRVRSGKAGAAARSKSLTKEEKRTIAMAAAAVRWRGDRNDK